MVLSKDPRFKNTSRGIRSRRFGFSSVATETPSDADCFVNGVEYFGHLMSTFSIVIVYCRLDFDSGAAPIPTRFLKAEASPKATRRSSRPGTTLSIFYEGCGVICFLSYRDRQRDIESGGRLHRDRSGPWMRDRTD